MGFMKQLMGDVRFRPYGSGDAERLRAMSERLTPYSLYLRFFTGSPRIPETYVRLLGHVDHWDHEALVALVDGEVAGIAEYIRDKTDPCRAEIAMLVTDPWQRHGLGRAMIGFLAELAGRRGITEFDADIMLENHNGLSAVHSMWPGARGRFADGAAHFRLPLARLPCSP